MSEYTQEQLQNFTLEELKSFTKEQLAVLSIESLKSDLRMRKDMQEENERIEKFWLEEYPTLSRDEKVKYWAGDMFRSMRDQEESGLKVYAIYSKEWLKDTLIKEPDFLRMLPNIYNTWGGMFDSGKVDRIIQKLLKELE